MFRRDPFAAAKKIVAPRTKRRAQRIRQHGKSRTDPYAWLRSENWRDVLRNPEKLPEDIRAALEAENGYYAKVTDELSDLRAALYEEMRGRIKEHDASVPLADGPWRYWSEYREGGEYPIVKRAPREGGPAQILFDGDAERSDSAFFNIGSVRHSPDHRLIAYAVDRVGSENFVVRIREIETGAEYEETIEHTGGYVVWSANSDAFFYIERDEHQRPKRVRLHRLGAPASDDRIVYEESDDGFFVSIDMTQSRAFIVIEAGNHATSEVRVIPADDPDAPPMLIAKREEGVEYDIDHRDGRFYIRTNADGAIDSKIVTAPIDAPGRENWADFVPHREGAHILAFYVFRDFIVRLERRNALPHVVVMKEGGQEYEIAFDEAAYAVSVTPGYEFDTRTLRLSYESPATPTETYDYDMETRRRVLLKTKEIPSGHDKSRYEVERIEAQAEDGAMVPVTILRLASTPLDGKAPVLLYGYGSYGITVPADFLTSVLSIVDRGMIYAVAHVRGGAALGRKWYMDGKLEKKSNSFTDFIAAAEALIAKRYTKRGRIVIYGGSAGGMLVGASVNLRPDLFGGVLAAVPFVDVLNTISDESLPLTPPEWPEWGNPIKSSEAFDVISRYSPYENIRPKAYPPVMATGGIADFRVTYWEPAKWIARLREVARGGPFVLRMNMGAGHAGPAARFERLDEAAHLYAFALKCVGLHKAKPGQKANAKSKR